MMLKILHLIVGFFFFFWGGGGGGGVGKNHDCHFYKFDRLLYMTYDF
jgi:hypothetical protein